MKYAAIDIGNVCIAIDRTAPLREMGLPADTTFSAEMIDFIRQLEFGIINENEFFQLLSGIPACKGLSRNKLMELYDSILRAPIPGMKELLTELPELGVMPVFFSDISTFHLAGSYKRMPEMQLFEGIFSFNYGAYKPSKIMFDAFEQKYGKPIIYTDDRAELIEGALANNWNAHCFVSAEILRKQIIQAIENFEEIL